MRPRAFWLHSPLPLVGGGRAARSSAAPRLARCARKVQVARMWGPALALVQFDRLFNDLTQLGEHLLLVGAMTPAIEQSGTTADVAAVLLRCLRARNILNRLLAVGSCHYCRRNAADSQTTTPVQGLGNLGAMRITFDAPVLSEACPERFDCAHRPEPVEGLAERVEGSRPHSNLSTM